MNKNLWQIANNDKCLLHNIGRLKIRRYSLYINVNIMSLMLRTSAFISVTSTSL